MSYFVPCLHKDFLIFVGTKRLLYIICRLFQFQRLDEILLRMLF